MTVLTQPRPFLWVWYTSSYDLSSLRHLSFFNLSVLICRLTAVSTCPTWDPWLWRADLQTPSPALTLIPTPAPTTCVDPTDTPITLSATTASTLLWWAKVWKQATRLVSKGMLLLQELCLNEERCNRYIHKQCYNNKPISQTSKGIKTSNAATAGTLLKRGKV